MASQMPQKIPRAWVSYSFRMKYKSVKCLEYNIIIYLQNNSQTEFLKSEKSEFIIEITIFQLDNFTSLVINP